LNDSDASSSSTGSTTKKRPLDEDGSPTAKRQSVESENSTVFDTSLRTLTQKDIQISDHTQVGTALVSPTHPIWRKCIEAPRTPNHAKDSVLKTGLPRKHRFQKLKIGSCETISLCNYI
ncbi:hypothetical protein TNCT_177611, partial [Trichonephila clavata]